MGLSVESNPRLTPLDKYLMLGNKLYQLYKTGTKQDIFMYNGKAIWYDPQIDGKAFSRNEVEATHPEALI